MKQFFKFNFFKKEKLTDKIIIIDSTGKTVDLNKTLNELFYGVKISVTRNKIPVEILYEGKVYTVTLEKY